MWGLPSVQPTIDAVQGAAQQTGQVAESVNTGVAPAAEAVRDGLEQVRAPDSGVPDAAEGVRGAIGVVTTLGGSAIASTVATAGAQVASVNASMQTINIKKDFLNVKKLEADNNHVRMTYGQYPSDQATTHDREAKQQARRCRNVRGLVRESQEVNVKIIDPAQRRAVWNELRERRRMDAELQRLMPDPDEIEYPSLGAALTAAAAGSGGSSHEKLPFFLFIFVDYHPVSWGRSIERIHVDENLYRSGFRICGCIGVDGNPRCVLDLASTVKVPEHNSDQLLSHYVRPTQLKHMLWTGRKHSDLLRYVSIGNKKYRNTALASSGTALAEYGLTHTAIHTAAHTVTHIGLVNIASFGHFCVPLSIGMGICAAPVTGVALFTSSVLAYHHLWETTYTPEDIYMRYGVGHV